MMKWLVLGLLLSSPAMAADNMTSEMAAAAPPVAAPPPADPEVTMRLSELQMIINAAAAQQIAAPALAKLQQQIKAAK